MTSTLPAPATPTSAKPDLIGAGYLYHLVPEFTHLHQRLLEVGGRIDMIEYLAAHFGPDPGYVAEVNRSMGDPPSSLHTYELMIGSVDRPSEAAITKMRSMVEMSNCRYIGEHVGVMGTKDVYTGSFLQPFGTDEQTQCFVDNIPVVAEQVGCPVTIENQSQCYRPVGPRSICEQIRDIAVGADTGILLSLSNIIISEKFLPMDRDRELAAIPLDRVWQVHLPLGNAAQLTEPEFARDRQEQEWANRMLVELFGHESFRPASIVFEVEDAGTPVHAGPEQLRDALAWARDLLGMKEDA